MAYQWAANKQKLNRSIAFVNSGLGEQIVSDEKREQMVKEYYIQVGGLVIENESAPSEQLKCDQCDYVARKEAGLAIHKGKEHQNV